MPSCPTIDIYLRRVILLKNKRRSTNNCGCIGADQRMFKGTVLRNGRQHDDRGASLATQALLESRALEQLGSEDGNDIPKVG
jgi:hypothetical protein